MIIDTLDNLDKYYALNPLFEEVTKFLNNNNWDDLADSKTPIKGDDLFVNVQHIKAMKPAGPAMEWHRKMIDIQVPISGDETFGYTPLCDLPPMEYVEAKDMAKLAGVEAQTYFTVKVGQFAIFFPQDGHAPGITDEVAHRKAIFKVKA